MERPCEFGTEPPGYISHVVSAFKNVNRKETSRKRWEDNVRMDLKEINVNAKELY